VTEEAVDRQKAPWKWRVWSLPAPALGFILAVDVVAAACVLTAGLSAVERLGDLGTLAVLLACAAVSTEGARVVERRRRQSGALHKDLQPVWLVAGAILLPLTAAVAFVIVQSLWWFIRTGRCAPYRRFFSTAVSVLGVAVAHYASDSISMLLHDAGAGVAMPTAVAAGIVCAAIGYLATDIVLCGIAIKLLEPESTARDAFGGPAEWAVDAMTGGLACVVTAAAMLSPALVLLAIPVTLTAQRALLLRQLEEEVTTDQKTEVANFPWWRERVERLLLRVSARQEHMAILFIDIDYFRAVNAQHGHLVGDRALRAVAEAMQNLTRSCDIVGRFGGEEFVIALPSVGEKEAFEIAERIRTEIANTPLRIAVNGPDSEVVDVWITVSVGLATYPETGSTLDELLELADRALYAAKAAGRDQTVRAADLALTASALGAGDDMLQDALHR
jgi:diguanylate cyclase (GGDEF)-like protein